MPRPRKRTPEPIPAISHSQCIAKTAENQSPGISVGHHSTNVAEVGVALREALPHGLQALIPKSVLALMAAHDVGKVSLGFQLKYFRPHVAALCPELSSKTSMAFVSNHAEISEAALAMYLTRNPTEKRSNGPRIIGVHHGKRTAPLPDHVEQYGGSAWSEQRQAFLAEMFQRYGEPDSAQWPEPIERLAAGMVTVADWLGSDETWFSPSSAWTSRDQIRHTAEQAVAEAGWRLAVFRPGLRFEQVFPFPPNDAQRALANAVTGPGLYILEASTGIGKTEAALYAAYQLITSGRASGIYFGLPTRLTSEKIHERVDQLLEIVCESSHRARLAHGSAWLTRLRQTVEGDWKDRDRTDFWFNARKRSLLYPLAVGTIDQALLSVLNVKHAFVRSFGLAGKVVILDEVHTYDAYTGTLLKLLIDHLLEIGATVIVLSATLTHRTRHTLLGRPSVAAVPGEEQAFPLISYRRGEDLAILTAGTHPSREISVAHAPDTVEVVAERALARARRGECVLCIANTVAKAQAWCARIRAEMHDEEFAVGLLHSKYLPPHRQARESQWLARLGKPGGPVDRPRGAVLVATQVVEQSVDIDADHLITQLVPTDMLLQRIGRLWRHDREGRPCQSPCVTILSTGLADAETAEEIRRRLGRAESCVYSPYVLWRSWETWHQRRTVVLPNMTRELLEATYADESHDSPAIEQLRLELANRVKKLEEHALAMAAEGLPVLQDDERVATRYSDQPTTDCLIVRSVVRTKGSSHAVHGLDTDTPFPVDSDVREARSLLRLHENILSIASHQLPKDRRPLPDWLQKHLFGDVILLTCDTSGRLYRDHTPTALRYDPFFGLCRVRETPASDPEPDDEIEFYSDYEQEETDNLEDWHNESDW